MSTTSRPKRQARKSAVSEEVHITKGSNNVFDDLGLADPELELAKSRLVMEILRVIEERNLSHTRAGEIMGLSQFRLSRLLNGHWKGHSFDLLIRYLNKLGVTIRVTLERNGKTWRQGQFIVGGH